MPLFSEHISNMYYGGSPAYSSPSYGYKSSYNPLGSSYSASYLNPGGSYSSHSSLSSYSRTPLTSRWIPGVSRSYSPMLTTITERGSSSPIRVNSPRRLPLSKRSYGTPSYIQRPININTADIDVSKDRYRHKPAETSRPTSTAVKPQAPLPQLYDSVNENENSPFMPRVDGKPETGIDSSPGSQRNTIKRGRTVVRLHTIKRKDKDSPRKPMDFSHQDDEVNTQSVPDVLDDNVESEPKESLSWREKLSDDLVYVEKRKKKSLGTKLVEKFIVKNESKQDIKIDTTVKSSTDLPQKVTGSLTPSIDDIPYMSKSPDRRCSMELLAEQANVLDSLIRGENLSTATLDLSKVGLANKAQNKFDPSSSIRRRKTDDNGNPLKTTKSDHSLHDNLKMSLRGNDSKIMSKRKSLKKSHSGGSICRLDSITEFPKDVQQTGLPAIEESTQSQKSAKTDEKPKLRTKITTSVEISPPTSPLKFRIENVTVEEKHHIPKKELTFTYEVNEIPFQDVTLETPKIPLKITKERVSIKKRSSKIIGGEPASPDPDDGNFWDKIGKRETVYLKKRKENIEAAKEENKKALFWFPEDEEANDISNEITKKPDLEKVLESELIETVQKDEEPPHIDTVLNKVEKLKKASKKLGKSKSSENMQKIHADNINTSLKEKTARSITEVKHDNYLETSAINDQTVSKVSTKIDSYTKNTKNTQNEVSDSSIAISSTKESDNPQNNEVVKPSAAELKEKIIETNLTLANIKAESILTGNVVKEIESQISKVDLPELNMPSIEKSTVTEENLQLNIEVEQSCKPEFDIIKMNLALQPVSIKNTYAETNQVTEPIKNEKNTDEKDLKLTINEDTKIENAKTVIDVDNSKPVSQETAMPKSEIKVNKSQEIYQNISENQNKKSEKDKKIETATPKEKVNKQTIKKKIEKKKEKELEKDSTLPKEKICETCKKCIEPDKSGIVTNLGLKSKKDPSSSKQEQEKPILNKIDVMAEKITEQEGKTSNESSVENSKDSNSTPIGSTSNIPVVIEPKNIPSEHVTSETEPIQTSVSTQEKSDEQNKAEKEVNDKVKQESIKIAKFTPRKPVKEEKAARPLIATPRPLQKRSPQVIHSSESSDSSSEEDSSEDEDSESSEDSAEFFECEVNPDGRTSTGSNDSGFDSSAPTSPASFFQIKKDCDVNCHRKCEKLTANLCGVNQRLLVEALATRTASKKGGDSPGPSSSNASLPVTDILERELEQSTAYGIFRKTGRFTPPARSIPRFRKYTVEDFQFIKVLGKGSFGKVLLAELRDTEYYYAVKCLKKDVVLEDDDVECTLIERKVLALGTNHPYLCHLFATFQTDSHLFFVMEYLNGGDLMFHIQQSGRFPEARARFYGAEIVSGLKFLHKRGIVYRDLKLDNILLDFDGHVRIADFGMCKLQIYLDKTADTFCGTPDYMAPEIIKGLKYNQTVDWWSFGVLLYEMLIGQSPFSGCDEDELFWSICNEMPSYPRFLSREGLTILTRLLDKDARTRLGGTECMHGDIREQEFFNPVHWDKLERRELEAPFRPRVRHPLDTQYFDRAFTGERPRLTAVEPQVLRSMDQEPFRGFSYTNPNATDR